MNINRLGLGCMEWTARTQRTQSGQYTFVNFGVLFEPSGRIYGLDVHPHHIKAQLTYSLHRLGLDYEDIIGELADLKQAGYIRSIGMTKIDTDTLKRVHKVHPIHMVGSEYSLIERANPQAQCVHRHSVEPDTVPEGDVPRRDNKP